MTFFIADFDGPAIVMNHCRMTSSSFKFTPLSQDPKNNPNYEYAEWGDLNRNHVGNLSPEDRIFWRDHEGTFWEIRIYPQPRPVDRSGLEAIKNMG
jgi:hypothetical protein